MTAFQPEILSIDESPNEYNDPKISAEKNVSFTKYWKSKNDGLYPMKGVSIF